MDRLATTAGKLAVRVAAFALVALAVELAWLMFARGPIMPGILGAGAIATALLWLWQVVVTMRLGWRAALLALLASLPLLVANGWLLLVFRSCARGDCF